MGQGVCLRLGLRQEVPLRWMLGGGMGNEEREDQGRGLGDGVELNEAGQAVAALESGRFPGKL